jgi:phage terminase large subunit
MNVEWCEWNKIINKAFEPLVDNTDRYLILYGGRGSSKSDFAAKKLIYRCLSEDYFRCVLIRNTYSTIKDSSYQTLKDIIFELGLESLFDFKLSPLEIVCKNGNKFIARGCDDVKKLKSIKDPSAVWYEEDIPSEQDFITITSGVRTSKADYLQEIFTINPEVEGNYQDHWFFKYFFEKHSTEKTFSDKSVINIGKGKQAEITYTCHHSTYYDNKYISNEFIAKLVELKAKNPYYYSIYCLGEWGNKQTSGLFYKLFSRAVNVSYDVKYNEDLALHLSFDFNVNPHMSASVWQIVNKQAICIDEIASPTPNNTTKGICKEFIRRYQSHRSGLFIYGDPSGKNADTRSEKGYNDYKIIENELQQFRPTLRVASKHPSVVMRGNFINTILCEGFNGVYIVISQKCVHLINDFLFLKEHQDGTKLKEKTQKDGISYEKHGHFSDGMDYFICEAFKSDFQLYQNGSKKPQRIFGGKEFNYKKNY